MTAPLVVIGALAIGTANGGGGSSPPSSSGGVLPPIDVTAPPNANAQAAPCAKVIEQLPVQLGHLDPRVVHTHPDTPYVVAWGDPAVVLACGVDRPKDLVPGSSADFILGGNSSGPFYDVQSTGGDEVWTTVDRTAYISISVPPSFQGSTVLPPLSRAIAKALPAVCSVASDAPVARLCTRRK